MKIRLTENQRLLLLGVITVVDNSSPSFEMSTIKYALLHPEPDIPPEVHWRAFQDFYLWTSPDFPLTRHPWLIGHTNAAMITDVQMGKQVAEFIGDFYRRNENSDGIEEMPEGADFWHFLCARGYVGCDAPEQHIFLADFVRPPKE